MKKEKREGAADLRDGDTVTCRKTRGPHGYIAGLCDKPKVVEMEKKATRAPAAPLDLGEIMARSEKATPGPWTANDEEIFDGEYMAPWVEANGRTVAEIRVGLAETDANAAFIAHARTDLPALVEEVKRLREALRALLYGIPDFPHPETPQDVAVDSQKVRIIVRDVVAARIALGEPK